MYKSRLHSAILSLVCEFNVSKSNSVLHVSLPCDDLSKLCRSKARLALGDTSGALEDADEAIRIAPRFPQVFDFFEPPNFLGITLLVDSYPCLAIHVIMSTFTGIRLKSTSYNVY